MLLGMNFKKIEKIILNSDLISDDKGELVEAFSELDEDNLKNILELFIEDNSLIRVVNQNYKDKKVALSSGTDSDWKKIILEEEFQLEKANK